MRPGGTVALDLLRRSVLAAVLAAVVLLLGAGATAPRAAAADPTTEGIDVSHWQGEINWKKVHEAGKRFAFIKASEGTRFVDDRFAINKARAEEAGLYVGAYHFARPSTSRRDAVRQADHFVRTADIEEGDLLPVLDLEVARGLAPDQLRSWTRGFLERVYERTGERAILYVSPAFWRRHMGDTTWFADNGYKVLWIAHWTSGAPTTPADNWGDEGWTFWQYTSNGRVPGIAGRVDLNRYNGTDFDDVLVE